MRNSLPVCAASGNRWWGWWSSHPRNTSPIYTHSNISYIKYYSETSGGAHALLSMAEHDDFIVAKTFHLTI